MSKQIKPAIFAYGKVPALAEYLRVGPQNGATRGFEEWLHKAVEWAAERRGEDWSTGYDQFESKRFLYRCGDGESVLAGVVRPSRDSVSRRFPLVCYGQLAAKSFSNEFHLAPMLLDSFFEKVERQLAAAQEAKTPADFSETITRLELPEIEPKQPAAEYSNWLERMTVRELMPSLYLDEPLESIRRALHTIVDASVGFRGGDSFASPLSIRVPHVSDQGRSLGFWLDVVRHAQERKGQAIGWFSSSAQALIQMGEQASSSVLADLWVPRAESDHVCDLTDSKMLEGASLVSLMPRGLVESLEDPGCSLGRVLERVGG